MGFATIRNSVRLDRIIHVASILWRFNAAEVAKTFTNLLLTNLNPLP